MSILSVNFNQKAGKVKPMHCTNNGPINYDSYKKIKNDLEGELWKASGIPYARTHDSCFCDSYGGDHTIDIHAIFPDFDADVTDPQSYDFAITDTYIERIVSCGTQIFYRLGSSIEVMVKKYHTYPPKDFKKWARICEHIIKHYNEGWADGFRYNIQYWEIWNEPDLDEDDSPEKRTWGGTAAMFYEFYETASIYLKECFPDLKIGGPAVAFPYESEWIENFLKWMTRDGKHIPMDFFSWHTYGSSPEKMFRNAKHIRDKLDEYGYTECESILNEWNYVKSWDELHYNMKHMLSIKGAAFYAACMLGGQNDTEIDMLMYYDARPSRYNGIFEYYTGAPLKGYYAFKMFNTLYKLGNACNCEYEEDNIYAAAAREENCTAVMISYFNDDDNCSDIREIELNFEGGAKSYDIFLLDEEKDAENIGEIVSGAFLEMKPNTVVLLKSK